MSKVYYDCKRKARFPDEHAALKRANRIRREGGELLECYYCEYCNGYHLTKNTEFNENHKHKKGWKGYKDEDIKTKRPGRKDR